MISEYEDVDIPEHHSFIKQLNQVSHLQLKKWAYKMFWKATCYTVKWKTPSQASVIINN